MMKILKMKDVSTVVGDQCQFGLETIGPAGASAPARKRTRFMSNSNEILKELGRLCPGDHVHQHLVSGRAERAAVYPEGLCRAICRGLVRQMEVQRGQVLQLLNLSAADVVKDVPEDEESQNQWQAAWDDVSGKEFDPSGVRAARALDKHVNMQKGYGGISPGRKRRAKDAR